MNAVEMSEPLAPYEMLCGLLVPLYVPRATEEVLYGRRGVTLQTSREVTGSAFMEQTQGLVNLGHSARQQWHCLRLACTAQRRPKHRTKDITPAWASPLVPQVGLRGCHYGDSRGILHNAQVKRYAW